MKTNREKLVMMSVQGKVDHPGLKGNGYRVGYDGKGRIPIAVGGIVYNYKIGDSCMGIMGDHVEPSVSLKNPSDKENGALQAFSCIGNIAKVISGDAKGDLGYVTGKHGGIDHVMVHFPLETLEKMTCNDQVFIKSFGQGLKLLDYPNVHVMNIDPDLLQKMNIKEENGKLVVPVTHKVPAYLMGSGLGSATTMLGDYDIMTQDKKVNEELNLNALRFGDVVAIMDHDNTYGPHYHRGAVSVGVICHSDSYTSGHGPGVTVIMAAVNGEIEPVIDENANIANYLNV